MARSSRSNRFRPRLNELESRTLLTAPLNPLIINPLQNAQTSSFSMRLEIDGASFFDADGDTHAATSWTLREVPGAGGATVWQALNKTDPTGKVHVSFSDGSFVGSLAGQNSLLFSHDYQLVVTVTDSRGEVSTSSITNFTTLPQQTPVPGAGQWNVQAGYRIEVVGQEGAFRLPTKIAFVPNPGSNPTDPLFYVSELYGSIKVVARNGTISTYASGLLDFNPEGPIAGTGEQGLTGIVVDPQTGDLFVTMLWDNGSPPQFGGHYPKIERLRSTDGGKTMASRQVILNMQPEVQGQAHQISEVTIGTDGKLYVHMGDAFDPATALNLNSFRGKILRLNKDGTAPTDNPLYNASNGITATDYIYSYGHRNPFSGAWRAATNELYIGETGNTIDHLAVVERGGNFGYDGTDASVMGNTIYDWNPSTVPAGLAFVQQSTLGGSLFPASTYDSMYVGLTGPTYAGGVQANGKRIDQFTNLDSVGANGKLTTAPTTLVKYNGTGRYTIVGVSAGPDGLYFTTLFPDNVAVGPTAVGGSVFRVRYVGFNPTNVSATAGNNSATLNWTGDSLATSYNVYSRAVDGTETRIATGITGTTYAVTGLTNGISYSFFIRGVNAGGESQNSSIVNVTPGGGSQPGTNGLTAEYYDYQDGLSDIPNFNNLVPTLTRVEGAPNYLTATSFPVWAGLDTRFQETYAARYSGFINIPTTGSYTFFLNSDDGSRLYIDGQLVVENGGLHALQERSATINLTAGFHSIRLEYHEAFGEQQLQLMWSSPTIAKQIIPLSVLFTANNTPPANQAPTVATPASSSANPVTGSTTNLSVRGADDGGESNLTYQWSAVVKPTGAADPSFSVNGTNGSKNTAVSGLVAGAYTFRVTISDAQGLSVTSTVNVTVNAPPSATNGLTAEYYDLADALDDIPSFAGRTPDVVRTEAAPNYLTATSWPVWAGLDTRFHETYAARFSGFINIPTTGSYTFFLNSDDGSRLFINDQLVVENGGRHALRERSGTINLTAGFHSIRIEYHEAFGEQQLQLMWSSATIAKQIIPLSVLFTSNNTPPANQPPTVATPASSSANPVTGSTTNLSVLGADDAGESNLTYQWAAVVKPTGAADPTFSVNGTNGSKNTAVSGLVAGAYTFRVTILDAQGQSVTSTVNVTVNAPPTATNGLTAEYYDLNDGLTVLPNFTGMTPTLTRTEGAPNYLTENSFPLWAGLDNRFLDTYAARYTGFINIPTTGSYTFFVNADDGARLYINGQLLIDNDGQHAAQERSNTITLTAGMHAIRLEYFEAFGEQQLQLSWSSPTITKQIIPLSVLFTSNNSTPPANQPPTVATPASSSANPVTGSTTNLSVLGADDAGESNLTYQWAAVVKPTGAADPTFSVNGTNGSKNTSVSGLVAGAYTFRVTILDAQGQSVTSTVNVTVNAPPTATNGLIAQYYDLTTVPNNIPNLTGVTPDVTRVEGAPNYRPDVIDPSAAWVGLDPTKFKETYAARYSGFLNIATAGTYTFYLTSDDGSKLTINNQVVIDNDGLHATQEKTGSVTLAAGKHSILIEYLEAFGHQVLMLEWTGPGLTRGVIPLSALTTT